MNAVNRPGFTSDKYPHEPTPLQAVARNVDGKSVRPVRVVETGWKPVIIGQVATPWRLKARA